MSGPVSNSAPVCESNSATQEPCRFPKLLRPREAAEALCISERTLWTLTKLGEIPCVRLGRSVRYDPGDLRDRIQALKTQRTPQSGVQGLDERPEVLHVEGGDPKNLEER